MRPTRGDIDAAHRPGPSRDTSAVGSRLTSNAFVGRGRELTELELAIQGVASGQPGVVLVGGDSGVGKTRLVGELERRLSDGAVRVLRGEGVEQGEEELPYVPLTSALRPVVREHDPALGRLSAGSRTQLSVLLPGLDAGDARTEPEGQLRLFEALLELIDLLSEARPLVVILEDMHWADRSTRTFVSFLARGMRQERVMLVLTYRTDELHRRHPLRPLLAELERLDHVRRIVLEPFDRDEVTAILADILDREPDASLVERLFARSEGNALYTEELLAAGLDGRGAAPRSLRDAFMLRVERLSDDAQEAARAIAVGRRLDEATITAVSGLAHPGLHTALREAVAEQVLVAADDGRLRFRHALLREAVVDDLLPGERSELHLSLAQHYDERLEAGAEDSALAAEVAYHYAAAGDQPAALRAAVRAALAARDILAYGEAAALAERALELWPRVPAAEQMIPLDRVDVLRLAASSHSMAGDRARAEVLLREAVEELDPETDPGRYAEMLAHLGRLQWNLNRGVEGIATAKRALAILPDDDRRERVRISAFLARTCFLRGKFREAVADGEDALATAVAIRDAKAESDMLNTLGMAEIALGDVEAGIARLRRAIDLAKQIDDPDTVGYGYANLADMLSLSGRPAEALEVAREGLAAVPRRMTSAHDWMTLTLSGLAFEAGDWEAARAHLIPSPAQLHGVLLIFCLLRQAEQALGEGDEALAERRLEAATPLVASSSEPQWIGAFGALMAELLRRRHDLVPARAAVEEALDRLEVCTDDVMRIARVAAAGARVEADIAQRARDLRERGEEREAITRARLHCSRLTAAAQEGGPVERAWHAVGKAELARARGRNQARLWEAAASEWEGMSRPYETAILRWRAAEAYAEAEDRDRAAVAALQALAPARGLGSRWLESEVTGLAGRARLPLESVAGDGGATTEPMDGEDPFGLTRRERQVLALIAEGATNRQIGNALFMAEKTASVHVSRILSKLGVQSRTQAAAVAHRLHLDSGV
jgi:DNA-binding CsgD family transcriptional regulator